MRISDWSSDVCSSDLRIFSTGDVVYDAESTSFAKINSLEDAREHVRRLKAQGAMSIKNYNQPRRDQRQQVVVAAREENMLRSEGSRGGKARVNTCRSRGSP